ncbi:hypothetical protein JWV37_02130 [Sulfurospirillum sp. T05]|uniref:Uncharacterized protein n=1 Tax=Sulfurospirillum tamanense TaxID=2813362 RepID=A0ABS2WQS5_9BACT|nr:hypothetical protein [Sulfurospirillum tamanensis]MBN2963564.1 hypothetical protein [Sulfurospirillum tamanensis]
MKTLTLKIRDDYFDKFLVLLDMLPKKAVKIESKNKEEARVLQKNIKQALLDIEEGRSKVIRVIE